MNTAPGYPRWLGISALRLLATGCLALSAITLRAADGTMDAEIDFLVNAVANSSCTFIRNGKEYDAAAAGKHLEMKRQRGKRYYGSTEEFIERIASRSSWTGKDYLIRCPDGRTQTTQEWFHARLEELRADAKD